MSTFGLVSTLVSIAIFAVWLTICIKKFGLAPSYSAYNPMWDKAVQINNMHLWSIVTVIVAILLLPAMIERGEGNLLQCFGFFAPLYLIVVAFTPNWEKDSKQHTVHLIGTILCAMAAICWLFFVRKLWWVGLIALAICMVACFLLPSGEVLVKAGSGLTIEKMPKRYNYVFWLEMSLFAATYAAVIF